jgi:hypothetical protein
LRPISTTYFTTIINRYIYPITEALIGESETRSEQVPIIVLTSTGKDTVRAHEVGMVILV